MTQPASTDRTSSQSSESEAGHDLSNTHPWRRCNRGGCQGYFGLTPLSTPAIFGTFIAAMFGSVFPDIDQPKSKMGQQIPILSKLMRGTFGHRGFCHSLLFLLILHFLVVRFLPSMAFYSLVFCLGASTHLFFDMFNSPGVPLFWPVKIRVRIAKIRTESQFNSKAANLPEKMFRGVVCVLDVLLAVNMAVVLNGGFPAI